MIILAALNIVHLLEWVLPIAVALIALGVVVFVHEWGHFMVGRRVGIRAEAFSIGFGPILWRRKVGETEYRLSAILFGGYVKFAGMEGTQDKTPQQVERGFYAATPARRILATFAGPFMNVVLAFVLFVVLWGTGRKVPESQVTTVIGGVLEGSAAEEAGLQPGDRIVSISGRAIGAWRDVLLGVALGGKTLEVVVERDGSMRRVTVTPKEDPEIGARLMGVEPAQRVFVDRVIAGSEADRMGLRPNDVLQQLDGEPIYAGPAAWQEKLRACAGHAITVGIVRAGARVTLSGTMPQGTADKPPVLGFVMAPQFVSIHENPVQAMVQSLDTVWRTLKGLAMRRVKAKGLVGPVGIIGAITYSLRVSFTWFVWFAAFISLNLAIINLLPIPVVDGGHIVFSLLEAVRRKPMREKTMAIVTNVFAVLIIAFFLYVTFNDVRRLIPTREQPEEAPAGEQVTPDSNTGVAPEPGTPAPE